MYKPREKMNLDQYLISRNYQQADNRNNLELFKNLLQPHFLFNSLNNLYALSLRKSDETPEAIAGLSQLLERVVSFSRRDMVLLSEEIGLVNDYIALEKIWLGECSFVMDFR
jgi:LytS/YehU family sensor histidine kinase